MIDRLSSYFLVTCVTKESHSIQYSEYVEEIEITVDYTTTLLSILA